MSVREILERLKTEWAVPKAAQHPSGETKLRLRCSVSDVPVDEVTEEKLPSAVEELWMVSSKVRLFEDADYGQWGLVLLSPAEAASRTAKLAKVRSDDFLPGDKVIGEFLGDADLLVVRCAPNDVDFGSVLVATPLDPREDWYAVADDLESFLLEYGKAQGAKFWET